MPSISIFPDVDGTDGDGEGERNLKEAVSLSASGFGVPGIDLFESHLNILVMGLFFPSGIL